MQKSYQHGAPKGTKQVGDVDMMRIVLDFRHGIEQYYDTDTGRGLRLSLVLPLEVV
jgi:hypothetical protein